ncbi:MAG: glycosyltransferase family 4 protein [Bacteroidetes bacterium]|nr:glycosyltransferase family 4 protein [Bacteroidota bacterium]
MSTRQVNISMIDPVGIKAGMDHYDLLLLSGVQNNSYHVELYSNFTSDSSTVKVHQVFFNTGVSKVKAIVSNFFGFFKALRRSKKNNVDWIIVHVFRAGLFDLATFSLARLMGFRLCAIVHDIESLDTITLPIVRKTVIEKLPHLRIVHNEFCKTELINSLHVSIENSTHVIPHVHFRHLFRPYHEVPGLLDQLKSSAHLPGKIHAMLPGCLREQTPLLLFFGQIKKAKGLDVLLEAISQTKTDFKVIIAGKLRDDSWDRYHDIITVLNLKDRVIPVIRHITDEERDYLFSISNAIVLPYTRIYQSGVLLMAMSFPKLVIASDLPPNAELITHGKNGILFQSEHADSLAKEIDAFINGTYNSNSLQQKAFEDIAQHYSPEKIGELYRKILVK